MRVFFDYSIFTLQSFGGVSKYTVNLVENFNELSNKIFDEIGIRINSDIYINFPALSRLFEHYDDINELKNTFGNILKT